MKFTLSLLAILIALDAGSANGQNRIEAMDSFRSELWQREFRKKEKKEDEPATVSSGGKASQSGAFDGVDEAKASVSGRKLPGQAMLDDLRDETPIAELNVDAVANSEYRAGGAAFHNEASAWQLSRSGTDSEAPAASEMSEGPTMTTYMVGFMACIVVCGAMLTGRE